jgi:hypothetical protein
MNGVQQGLYALIETQVRAGFEEREAIIEMAIDQMIDQYALEWLDEHVPAVVDQMLQKHFVEQRSWNHETDCDRLDEAFAELDRHGVIARQNFSCCQTCGHAEISTEIEETASMRPVHGYVFYHQQDTDTVIEEGYLYLAYGAVSGREDESVAVGYEIVDALERAGLEVAWNGSIRKRIRISNIQWQRRRI